MIYCMRKEELDRRSAEMRARTLAQRPAPVREQPSGGTGRKSATKPKRDHGNSTIQVPDSEDVSALRNEIGRLESENKILRQQIAALTSEAAGPSRSYEDSVREQRHNFFKYSNVRRY
jgi:hypothetical protein